MIKLIVYLFLVTQIGCLAQDDNKNFKDDEIDLTTFKSSGDKDSPKDKSVPEYESKDLPKESPNDKSFPDYENKDLPKDSPKDLPNDKSVPEYESKDLPKRLPKDSPNDKSVPDYENKDFPKELPKDSPKDLPIDPNDPNSYKPDNNEKKETPEKKEPDYYPEAKSDKPVHNDPGLEKGKEVDEKITKKFVRPLYSERDIDLGKDYKKVVIKPNKNEKDSESEVPFSSYDPNTVGVSDKDQYGYDKKPDKGLGGEEEYGQDKGSKSPVPHNHEKEVQTANGIIDNLLKLVKTDYRSDFEQVKLGEFQPFNHGRWGSVKLHSGVVTGLSNAERVGNVVVVDEYDNKKLLIGDIAVKDVYADYKMDAKLFHRISFKDRELKLWLKRGVLNVKLEVDKNQKKLIVKEMNLKSFEEFSVKSGRLFWPFNKLTNAILKNQEQVMKDLIKKEFSQYMGKVVHNIQFDEVFGKLF